MNLAAHHALQGGKYFIASTMTGEKLGMWVARSESSGKRGKFLFGLIVIKEMESAYDGA